MDLQLQGKNVVVLAGSKGLGKAIAQRFLEEGSNVAFCSSKQNNVDQALSDLQKGTPSQSLLGLVADLSKKDEIDTFFNRVIKQIGEVDVLVTNAGGPRAGIFESIEEEEWYGAFELNFMSVVRSIKKVVPGMKKQKFGRILALTSIAVKNPVENLIVSNAIRAGVTGLIKTLSQELASYNITANTLCPGYIDTERVTQLCKTEADKEGVTIEAVKMRIKDKVPLKRLGTPEEFADLAVYLCSKQAAYITGSSYWIDGGLYRGLL